MTSCRCPACGAKLQIVANEADRHEKRSVFYSDAPKFFESSVAPSYPQRQQAPQSNIPAGTRRDVTHLRPETPADIATFALKSAGCGIAAMLLSICPTIVLDMLPWYTPIIVLPTVSGLSWFLVSGKAQGLVTFTENLTRLDLNNDGKIGNAPTKEDDMVSVLLDDGNGHVKIARFPKDPKFHNLAVKILNGAPPTETTAKECGISRGRWEKIRDELVDRGCAVWKDPENHNLGVDILAAGRAALRAALPHSEDT